MNIRMVALPLLLTCFASLTAACALVSGIRFGGIPGSGNVQTETRTIDGFQALTIEYPTASVIVQRGNDNTVRIEAEDNVIPQISTSVSSARLTIKNAEPDAKAQVRPSKPVKITVTAKDLAEIDFAAPVGTLDMEHYQASALRLILSGGAQIRAQRMQLDVLDCVLSGAGDIQLSGTVSEMNVVLSGLGNFNAADLKSNKATVELSGMGNATVNVESELSATVSGTGAVKYFGHPRVDKTVTGAGSVDAAE